MEFKKVQELESIVGSTGCSIEQIEIMLNIFINDFFDEKLTAERLCPYEYHLRTLVDVSMEKVVSIRRELERAYKIINTEFALERIKNEKRPPEAATSNGQK